MILSFYCDDTGPYRAGTHAFQQFLDYCVAHGIAGESSVILGVEGRSMCQDTTAEEALYLAQAQRAFNCRVDTHLELMTHESLFDFQAGQARENGQHEGVWLHEPGVSVEEYEAYFAGIIAVTPNSARQASPSRVPISGRRCFALPSRAPSVARPSRASSTSARPATVYTAKLTMVSMGSTT